MDKETVERRRAESELSPDEYVAKHGNRAERRRWEKLKHARMRKSSPRNPHYE